MKIGTSHSGLLGLWWVRVVPVNVLFFFACLLKWAKAKRIIFLECFLIHDGFPVSLPQVYPFSCKITSASTQGFQRLFFLQTSFVTFSKQSHGICPIKISKMEKKTPKPNPKTLYQIEMWNNIQNHIGGCAWKVSLFLFAPHPTPALEAYSMFQTISQSCYSYVIQLNYVYLYCYF